ncbi:site-specific DNA-methyltransferase [Patescibacteria group bacterium]|nr:site-specific DNA-methyltransferase [Patescibacteria group bacterium]
MTKEQKFYEALQDVFIGAKIEGEGGFINLMRIKAGYYSQIEKLLQKDINKALEKHPAFRDELFDKLHAFFSRYFTDSGSIYFNSTPFHNNIYEKVYTDEKDVILFWKTQMLYYVKTDRIFRSMPVEIGGSFGSAQNRLKFYFDASKIENKKANEKRSLTFEIGKVREDGTIVFSVAYSERGRITKQDEILKILKQKGIVITEEQLEKAFRVFEKQSEVDFFINKNAKAFLEEQFKLWSYQYFWEGAKDWGAERVNQLQILKNIAFKIIEFISQFEDELVKVWNKPKFVRNSNYVITIDRITPAIIEKIIKHKNFGEQAREWEELGILEKSKFQNSNVKSNLKSKIKNSKHSNLFENTFDGKKLKKEYEHLPIDTKYFKELELEILAIFDDLDNQLDGWLIKSENYQALNTILPKFKERVQTIYIDPPFNLDSSDQFLYRTNYKDSNWATLLENRLKLAKNVLDKKGSIFVRCDYNGNWIVRFLMDEVFNYQNEIIISKSAKLTEQINKYHSGHDSLFFFSKSDQFTFNTATRKRDNPKWRGMHLPGVRWSPLSDEYIKLFSKENLREKNKKIVTRARIIFGKELLPPDGRHWALSQNSVFELEKEGKIQWSESGEPQTEEADVQKLTDNWTDWVGYSSTWGFTTENHEKVIERAIITSSLKNREIVADFFLGSGTTTAVGHKLGKKWLGVEMGEHFYSQVLPRMKEVLAGMGEHEPTGISKDINWQGGGFFKYYELEQYEDALANCKYKDSDLFSKASEKAYQDYVFMKDEKMLSALEIDYKNNKVKVDLAKFYPDIDIAETLSNLTGKWIKRISDGEVEFVDGSKINTKDLDYKLIKPLIWW